MLGREIEGSEKHVKNEKYLSIFGGFIYFYSFPELSGPQKIFTIPNMAQNDI